MKHGATTACTMRLGDPSDRDVIMGDASVKTATVLDDKLDCNFIGHVKTAHSRFPKKWLEETMEEWPCGTHLVLESLFGKENLIAVSYKYNKKKVCHFIMTQGASMTSPGDPYRAKYRSDVCNYKSRAVQRPLAVSKYFGTAGKIDIHNQIRQREIALEAHWNTCDVWLRNVCTILGMAVPNAFFACSYSFARDCEYSQLKAKDFVSILAKQLVVYPFPDSSTFGKHVRKPGQQPPQWFELLPRWFLTNSTNPNALVDVTNSTIIHEESPIVGKTQLKPGWSQNSSIETVRNPDGAPFVPPDIAEYHRQVKIRAVVDSNGKCHRPPQCKICWLSGCDKKKPPYLCIECGDFFCHDTEQGRTGSCSCQCFWTHKCTMHKNSGSYSNPQLATEF